MKDEHDSKTGELIAFPEPVEGGRGTNTAATGSDKGKRKRLPYQSSTMPPAGAKPSDPKMPLGFGPSVVSVSVVARDWGISARRVRTMLTEGRLYGRQLDNGYWEVFYPYQYIFGTRGPAIKRQRDLPERPKKPNGCRNGDANEFDDQGENYEYAKTRNSYCGEIIPRNTR